MTEQPARPGGFGRRQFIGAAAGAAGVAGLAALALPGNATASSTTSVAHESDAKETRKQMTELTFLGSYSNSGGDGLDRAATDTTNGTVTVDAKVSGVPDASWLAYSLDRSHLYTTNEDTDGTVTALLVTDPSNPVVVDEQSTEGDSPTFLNVHPTGKYLLVANYGSGSVAVLPLNSDGSIGTLTDVVTHTGGTGGAPHAHQIVTDPSGNWILAVDLGTDSVYVYQLDLTTGKLSLHDQIVVAKGTGPRHLIFHPTATHGYLVAEDASEVIVFSWDATAGKLTPGQIVGTLGPDPTTPNYPAEGAASSDGRFVYVTNRGDNSLATFAVGDGGASLTLLSTISIGGDWPRHFALDPTESWFVVANQNSGTVTWLPRDRSTGLPGPVAGSVAVPAVAMVLF
ncbi:MAG TPA: lactonase family protein [Pseudonocardiaceae bacterium]|jgi:6-phosphogluconolactonase (cycloisomerase 2 family)|nr:lactonase family protein [Pseudonocardiaceae bacterium]